GGGSPSRRPGRARLSEHLAGAESAARRGGPLDRAGVETDESRGPLSCAVVDGVARRLGGTVPGTEEALLQGGAGWRHSQHALAAVRRRLAANRGDVVGGPRYRGSPEIGSCALPGERGPRPPLGIRLGRITGGSPGRPQGWRCPDSVLWRQRVNPVV